MPAVTSGKVLVTGANGYIATWIVKTLLDAGFAVRGTVRSESKTKHLRDLFKSAGDRLELVVVDNITKVRDAPRTSSMFVPHRVMVRKEHSTSTSKTSLL
ncbi:hypothetical protein NUW54_g11273 [Trametes sanguinea]|uniref:Uncharacterized protein n=1 Tax=Trametes sanguinea TaxID=158606 RepID=A0ACC1NGW8_9APHY|nr:hypothetical protein NUW54_g11273 [Trametes sanguinea]